MLIIVGVKNTRHWSLTHLGAGGAHRGVLVVLAHVVRLRQTTSTRESEKEGESVRVRVRFGVGNESIDRY